MPRLSNRAYQILRAEIEKRSEDDSLSQIEQKLVLEELEKLRSPLPKASSPQFSTPATLEELRTLVIATYPNFSEKALCAAAQANRSSDIWHRIRVSLLALTGATVMLVGSGGVLGLAIILLSSTDSEPIASKTSSPTNFASMSSEEHLQEATILVEQVEELVNKIKTPANLALCERKLNEAKKHLDEVPASYTVSSAQQTYTRPSKRRSKRRYTRQTVYYSQSVSSDRNEQLASIRSRFDQLQANVTALKAQQVRTSSLIKAAQEFALTAAKAGQNPPHSTATWRGIEILWQKAIDRLEEIPVESPSYIQAQKLLATYQASLETVHTRSQAEQKSVEAFERAQSYIKSLLANTPADAASLDRSYTISQLQEIINELQKVQHGTSVYLEAKQLLQSAQNKLKQLQS